MASKNNPLEGKGNIFLTGPGGTGKTYLLNEYIENHKGRVCVCAPTGTAASNIGGVTMHTLFNIPVPAYGVEDPVNDNKKATKEMLMKFAMAEAIIIDEISMASAPVFSYAIKVIRMAEKATGNKPRIIVSGDFSQLPPVVTKEDEKYFKRYGFNKSGYCFTTPEWKSCKFKTIELTEIKRQENKDFIENLNMARKGDRKCLKYFNNTQFVVGTDNIPEDAIWVCGLNSTADKKNKEYLDSLPGEERDFNAKLEGKTGKDIPCELSITLKEGCRVIFTANDTIQSRMDYDDSETMRYTNGLCGIIKGFSQKQVEKKNSEGGTDTFSIQTVIVETELGDTIEIGKHKWSVYDYKINKETSLLEKNEIGSIVQIPLKVAKAITIHKSQGKTFSKAAIAPEIFAPGQLYVALSRVRSPEGMYLTEPVFDTYLSIDPVVKKFYNKNYDWDILKEPVEKTPVKKTKPKTTRRKNTRTSTKRTVKSSTKKSGVKKTAKPKVKSKTTPKRTTKKSTTKKTVNKKPTVKKNTSTKKTQTKKTTKTPAKRVNTRRN